MSKQQNHLESFNIFLHISQEKQSQGAKFRVSLQRRFYIVKFWTRFNFLHFYAVFTKIWPNNKLATPCLVMAPPLGNPGSALAR